MCDVLLLLLPLLLPLQFLVGIKQPHPPKGWV
jgi:hypothetical protein